MKAEYQFAKVITGMVPFSGFEPQFNVAEAIRNGLDPFETRHEDSNVVWVGLFSECWVRDASQRLAVSDLHKRLVRARLKSIAML
ncbi:hypothetical protein BDV93DRAFT_522175 [Ceratobasidium sp. AG-I]|nr:hypothetical protein BDV93DRAFT_522175 [Ceratobasidium sp. AG-I]